jgi:ABC-2 type transport system ATP-binding protein
VKPLDLMLLSSKRLVFLDEPTIGLDLMAQNAVRNFIKNYQQEFKPIMILTSHYMDDIEELCERVALIQKGQLIYDGKLEVLKHSYASSKLIKAQAVDETEIQNLVHNFPKELGTLKISDKQILVHTPRYKTMEAATFLLNSLKIIDLNIHEEDVGEIIEKIMRQGKVHVSS